MIIRNIINKLNEWSEYLREFILKYDRNPLFYGLVFLILLGLAYIVYSALHKD